MATTAVFVGLHALHLPVIERIEFAWFDLISRAGLPGNPARAPAPADHLVLIDFDESSAEHAAQPALTPRAHLARLLAIAEAADAKTVILDIEFTASSPDDDALRAWFARPSTLNVVLYRPAYPVRHADCARSGTAISPAKEQRTVLDAAAHSANRVFWASALMPIDSDGAIRRLCPAYEVESQNMNGRRFLPTIPFVVRAIDGQHMPAGMRQEILDASARTSAGQPGLAQLARKPARPMRFTIRDPGGTAGVPDALRRMSLHDLMTAEDHSLLRGATILVGVTRELSRDRYQTPIGELPGVVILANAIRHLAADYHLDIASPSIGIALEVATAMIVVIVLGLLFWIPCDFVMSLQGAPIWRRLSAFLGLVIWSVVITAGVWMSLAYLAVTLGLYGIGSGYILPLGGAMVAMITETMLMYYVLFHVTIEAGIERVRWLKDGSHGH